MGGTGPSGRCLMRNKLIQLGLAGALMFGVGVSASRALADDEPSPSDTTKSAGDATQNAASSGASDVKGAAQGASDEAGKAAGSTENATKNAAGSAGDATKNAADK